MSILRVSAIAAASLVALTGANANASSIPAGSSAPTVVLQSVVDGKTEPYDLHAATATRPVVLYFFPVAFSAG